MVNKLIEGVSNGLDFIKSHSNITPSISLVLGSGLGDIAKDIEGISIPYKDIPGFPNSTAPSHKGILHIGSLQGVNVVAMQGRLHLYEGYSAAQVTLPMRVMAAMGASIALLTNAAGGLNPNYRVGNIICLDDHLSLVNLGGGDPLRGEHVEGWGERFVSMNKTYDPDIINILKLASETCQLDINTGVYGHVAGPTLESPAEVRLLKMIGCDLVGMSTVPEVIVARQMGLKVAALSVVTNIAVDTIDSDHITNAQEVWSAMDSARPKMARLIKTALPRLAKL